MNPRFLGFTLLGAGATLVAPALCLAAAITDTGAAATPDPLEVMGQAYLRGTDATVNHNA